MKYNYACRSDEGRPQRDNSTVTRGQHADGFLGVTCFTLILNVFLSLGAFVREWYESGARAVLEWYESGARMVRELYERATRVVQK